MLLTAVLVSGSVCQVLAAEDPVERDRTETLLADMDCAEKKCRLFSDYLEGKIQVNGGYKFRCAKGRETISLPADLAAIVSSMTAREIRVGKSTSTEARLWQAPLEALYDFSQLVRKTAPVKSGGLALAQRSMAGGCLAVLVRLDKAMAALREARLAGSFGGRGDLVFAHLARALSELDALERSYELSSLVTFYEKSAAVLKSVEDAFAALSGEPQAAAAAGGEFSAYYYAAPRLLEGLRSVSLLFPWHQLEGLRRGDRVDLMVTYENISAAGKDTITATIIQAAPVLSVLKPQETTPETKCAVRLLLSSVQAQYAALAAVQGRELALAVRVEGDAATRAIDAASFKKIIK
ncbi:MAG: hypothetical protein A2234_03405 [Elusimicrobia bacterium RIFOXYA2_FULL_58_8]|nr:MAG: hypothetical protein A2285_00155 [Elusimicrobia bacterium RIFOXYA12_FULL_57_11]OGS17174.1 MAG: hypothetical protein A2234_03405 [Elusimicrobia bacterium RIFOXYA2_FULL_58_8]